MKKAGKTARPFRYDLNQIPYDYIVEVRNRFKILDLTDRVPDELQNEVLDIVQETEIKTIPMEKKCKKAKWLSEEAIQTPVKRREAKGKEGKERYTHLNVDFQRIARRDKKDFFSDQCKETGLYDFQKPCMCIRNGVYVHYLSDRWYGWRFACGI